MADVLDAFENVERDINNLVQSCRQYRDYIQEKKAEKSTKEYEAEIEALKAEIEQLKQSSCNGDEQRVMHLIRNPADCMIESQRNRFGDLVKENMKLKVKLDLLESGQSADITRQIDEGIRNGVEVDNLKKELANSKRREKKIIEAAKRTSKEFREVCYLLTGYRIDIQKPSQYRLSSMYASSPDRDYLLFEVEDQGTIKLLQTNFSDNLAYLIETYLQEHDSYPAFLASLTMQLFRENKLELMK